MQQITLQCNSKIANTQKQQMRNHSRNLYFFYNKQKKVIFALANMKSKITNRFAFLKQTINNLFLN